MRQGLLLATRSLRSLDKHRLFALPTMAKQKVLPSWKLHMRGFFTRKRDDSFSPASRGTEMSVSVCVSLWPNIIFPFCYLLKWEYPIKPASIMGCASLYSPNSLNAANASSNCCSLLSMYSVTSSIYPSAEADHTRFKYLSAVAK